MQRSYQEQAIHRDPQGRLVIHIPMVFKKRSRRRKMVQPDESSIDKSQAIAIALGHRWMDLLINGTFHSVQELAEAVGLDPSQIRRYLELAGKTKKEVISALGIHPEKG